MEKVYNKLLMLLFTQVDFNIVILFEVKSK